MGGDTTADGACGCAAAGNVRPEEGQMLRSCDLVFDDVIMGSTAVYTDPKWNERMGLGDVAVLNSWRRSSPVRPRP